MTYLTYQEYTEIGGECDEAAFNKAVTRACSIITTATLGRIEDGDDIPQEVKALCRDLIEYINKNPVAESISSKSQSAGSVSESISFAAKSSADSGQDIDMLIYDYLMSVKDKNGTPLLYRGLNK